MTGIDVESMKLRWSDMMRNKRRMNGKVEVVLCGLVDQRVRWVEMDNVGPKVIGYRSPRPNSQSCQDDADCEPKSWVGEKWNGGAWIRTP